MKQIKCNGPGCEDKRIHWNQPYQPRGPQMINVDDAYEGLVFCSVECHLYYKSIKKDIDNSLEK